MIRMVAYLPKQRSWRIKAAWVLSTGIFVGHCSTVLAAVFFWDSRLYVGPRDLTPRDDMDVDQKFKKNYLENRYSLEEFEKNFAEWQDLMSRLFIRSGK